MSLGWQGTDILILHVFFLLINETWWKKLKSQAWNPRHSSSMAENKHVGLALLHVIGVVFEYGNFSKVLPPSN